MITFTYVKKTTGGSSSGGGSSSTPSSYVIKASAGTGGSISPAGSVSVERGKDQSFSIKAMDGYRISDVLVDGKSVGAQNIYTFTKITGTHTIEAKFAKESAAIEDPDKTGVGDWLQASDHIAYMKGYSNAQFGPNDNMTRAQVAQMFYNLLKDKNVKATVGFDDVTADKWYADAVNTLASLNVIKGVSANKFAPNRTITRAEFAVIAMRFAEVSADATNPFSDVKKSDWYYDAVTNAAGYGWITGYADGGFHPTATITRAEVATIVNRMLARNADHSYVDEHVAEKFSDVSRAHWAYYAITEATTAHDHTISNDGAESWKGLK